MTRVGKVGVQGVSLLLEVVFGMGIFSACLLLIFGVFPTSHRALTQAKNLALANSIARDLLEQELAEDFDSIEDAPAAPYPRQTLVNGVTATTQFSGSIEVTVLDTAPPYDRKQVVATVSWVEGPILRKVELESHAVRF
ncbi:MAG: hypothetical protein HY319_15615 [Armatimonadetes bacterium]|nr:hypothetical protein [Armatimonadota bacterium]